MKIRMKFPPLLLFLGFAAAANAALEFCGYTIIANEARFSLEDTEVKTFSGWLIVGKTFQGYTIAAFDAGEETLVLNNADGKTVRLPLRTSRIKDARMRVSGSIKVGVGEAIEVKKATLVMGEETAFTLKDGLTLRLKLSPFEGGAIRYDAVFQQRQPDGTQKVVSSPSVIGLPGKQFGIQIGNLGFSFEP